MSKRDEIWLVGPVPPQIGGIEFFVQALLNSKLSQLCRLRHFDISKPGSRMQSEFQSPMGYARSFRRNLGTTLISFSYSLNYFIRFCLQLPFSSAGLIHLNSSSYMSFWEKCVYLDTAKLFGRKVILHIHGSSFDRFIRESNRISRALLLWHLRRSDAVIALSESWKQFFCNYLPEGQVVVVENGVDISLFSQSGGSKAGSPTLVFLGEICQRKGVYDLLPAIRDARELVPDLQAVMIGPGEISHAQQLASDLGLSDCVRFTGPQYQQDKLYWLTSSWFLVLPSYAEVFPIVLLEAYACGLPVISTLVGGIPDFVLPEDNGLLIQPGDRQALSRSIVRLARDAELRRRMTENNHRMAREKFDINICADKIYALYSRFIHL